MRRSRFSRYCLASTLAILLALPMPAHTQDTPGAEPTISQLMRQIEELRRHDRELQQRIQALEAAQPKPSAPIPEPVAQAPPAAPQQASDSSLADLHATRGLEWRGYAELNYKALDQRRPELGTYGFNPGSAANFYTGDFGLFLTANLSEKITALAELNFEEEDGQNFKVDLRRLLLNYDVNDHLRLSLGRYQTGLGYYNWAFRSASWLQTTADRPLVMEFASNGGLLPTQAVGISLTGSIPSGPLNLNYIAEYGSSDTVRPDINGDGLLNEENNGNHVNVGLFAKPVWIPGFRIGGSVYHDQISDLVSLSAGGGIIGTQASDSNIPPLSARWNQTIANAHIVYLAKGVEFLNESFLIRHALVGGGQSFHTPAFYSQLSKRVGRIRPYARYQYVNASPNNFIYNDVGLRRGPSFGVRYDPTEYCAFKAQLDHTLRRGMPDLNGILLQISGAF